MNMLFISWIKKIFSICIVCKLAKQYTVVAQRHKYVTVNVTGLEFDLNSIFFRRN